jgi:RHS repeat-associated protein
VNLRRVHLLHLLVLLSLLCGTVPWQAPRAVYAAPMTPTQSLRTQMQPAHQQPDGERASRTRSDSQRSFGPPVQPDIQLTRYEHPAVIAPAAISPAPEARLNRPDSTPAEPAGMTRNVVAAPDSTPTPQATASSDSVTRAETRTQTRQNPAAQTHIYLPLIQSAGTGRTTEVKITSDGGQLRSPDGRVQLDVPAGAVSEDVWITLTQGGAHPPIGARHSLGVFFELTARTADGQPVTQFAQPLTLRVRYTSGAGMTDSTNGLFYYDEQQQRWQALETSDDAATGLLTATTDHFTQFGAFAAPAAGPCTPAPGEGADGTAISAIESTFSDQGLGCPSGTAYQWGGAWSQDYANGVVVYNGSQGAAYVVEGNYRDAYAAAGGPGGFLGLPTEHSSNAGLPPDYYQDYSSNFTGTPIQKFERGFVGLNNGNWEGARHYPLICSVNATVIDVEVEVPATPENPDPDPAYIYKKKVSIITSGIADPGNPGNDSFADAFLDGINETSGAAIGGFMSSSGNGFVYEIPDLLDAGDTIRFWADVRRASDNRFGYAPRDNIVNFNQFTFSVPSGTGPISLFNDCNNATLPGGTPISIPADTTPPVIGEPTLFQDGMGNVSFRVKVTDNRAVASVTLTVDGVDYSMLPIGNDMYEVVVYGLSVGPHTFEINAVDASGNAATPVAGTFKIEMSGYYGELDWQGYSPDPVNTYIGNYIYHYTDIKINEPGPDLLLERFYNAQSGSTGLFGRGWTTLFDVHLVEVDNLLFSGAQVRYSNGRTVNFPANGSGFDRAPTVFDELTRNGSGYILTRTDMSRYFFDDQGRLTQVEDRSGNTLTLTYTGDALSQVVGSSGRSLTFTSNSDGLVEQVDGPDGLTLTYTYNGDGQLTSMTDGNGVTVNYRYDADHGLIGLQTPEGHDFVAEQQFDAQGRVTFQRVGDNFINRFTYDDANRTTILTDTYGNTITYRYDEQGRLIEQIDAFGNSETWTYNDDNQRTSYTDRNGNTTRYDYNAQGDLIEEIDALGGVTTHAYDRNHNLLKTTDALGRVTEYAYDAQGRRTAIINALGERTELRYNPQGQIIEQISPRGFSTTYAYDAEGNLISETDALGGVTRHDYDPQGRRVKTVDANGHATTFTYDANGNLLTMTDANGNTTSYSYDANNNRISETDANGNTTTYDYNNLDTLLTTTAPDGGVTTITYDDMNNRIAETDPLGHTTRWGLDATYRVISETNAIGATTLYQYDPHGNRIAVTDANGHTTRYEFDALHRVVQIIDPLGNVTRYTYDAVGNRTSETNALGATTIYEYDDLNRVWRETDANGFSTTYTYDADGNRTSITDALGNVTRFDYDALNRTISETNALGHTTRSAYDAVGNRVEVIDARGFVTRSEYDPVNRLIRQTDALGQTTLYTYDAVGNQIAMRDARGHVTRTSYDLMNRPVEVIDAVNNRTHTAYDLAGRRIRTTDANGHTTLYRYDAVGRTIAVRDPLGFVERYTYDAVGNQVSLITKNGHSTRTEYDALNRIVAQTNALNATTRFVYDAVGNEIARIDANGHTTTYAYDARNQQVEAVNARGFGTRTEYDALGRAIRTTFADGSTVTRAYDAGGHLVAERDAEGFVTQYAYDAAGNQTVITDSLGVATETTYDALNRPVKVADSLGTIRETAYDEVGNVISQTDGNGNTTRTAYDALNRVVRVTDAAGNVMTTSYDAVGNRITVTDGNGNTTAFTYDARNQMIATTDPRGHMTKRDYDGIGQPVYEIDALGIVTANEYDAAGQLVAVTLNYNPAALADAQTNVTTRYEYDAVGNRISITNPNGSTVTFTPDELGQLVAETDALGHTTRYRYDGVGRQIERQNPDGTSIASDYDRNGLLLRETHSDGTVEERVFDGNRNLLELRDNTGVTQYAYDERNRPLREESDRGRISYSYDGANNRTSITYADGQTVQYAYNANTWLAGVTNPDGSTTTYERDGVGQVLRQVNGNGTVTTHQYDAANNLLLVETRQGDQVISSVAYDYNAINQRTQKTTVTAVGTPTSVTETYEQDALRRLVAATDSTGVQTRYRYDAAGNRLAWQSNDDPRTSQPFDALDLVFSYDAADQLVQAADQVTNEQTAYAYDANGNRIERRDQDDGTVYHYDVEHRLVSVETFAVNDSGDPREIAAMRYDGHGRRVAKAEAQGTGSSLKTTAYLYDGLNPIATYETWHSAYTNLYRAEGGRILSMDHRAGDAANGSAWFTQDALGSTVALTDERGDGTLAYRYDAYGSLTMHAGSSDVDNAFTFTGQELDASTGLYHFHARDYDPATATWLTRDPYRGTPDDPQSLHRYGYVKGNPVNLWDAWGYAAQGGTYGKNPEPISPFIEAILKLGSAWTFERKWELGTPKLPESWPLPKQIADLVDNKIPKIEINALVGISTEEYTQHSVGIAVDGNFYSTEECLNAKFYGKLEVVAQVPVGSWWIVTFYTGVAAEGGVESSFKVCRTHLHTYDGESKVGSGHLQGGTVSFVGQARGFIKLEVDALIARGSLEAGLKADIEIPIFEFGKLERCDTPTACIVDHLQVMITPGAYGKVEGGTQIFGPDLQGNGEWSASLSPVQISVVNIFKDLFR